jgi:hypothetical protein
MAWRLRVDWMRELASVQVRHGMEDDDGEDGAASDPSNAHDIGVLYEVGQAMDRNRDAAEDDALTLCTTRVHGWWQEALRCRGIGREWEPGEAFAEDLFDLQPVSRRHQDWAAEREEITFSRLSLLEPVAVLVVSVAFAVVPALA